MMASRTEAIIPRKRRRAKVACEPCRERKRKCEGQHPCATCVQLEYDCFYSTRTSKRRVGPRDGHFDGNAVPGTANAQVLSSRMMNDRRGVDVQYHLQSLEANSGAAFVRRLGLNIDPSNAPRLHLFAWNTGERLAGCSPGTTRPVTSMLTGAEMRRLALVYFEKVAGTYGFIDRMQFFERLGARWRNSGPVDPYDPVLCGVAALGLLFSERSPMSYEPDLVETAKALLEQHSLATPPSMDTITGWVLRVAYLRMTSTPHVAWLASCSLMHLVEAASIHLEAPLHTVFDGPSESVDPDIRRRIWGMAQHFNIWASFDLGRSKITLSGASTKPVEPKSGDYTSQVLGLIPLTEPLDPTKSRSVEELESDMTRVLAEERDAPTAVMTQVNLMLCIFRRLRAQKSNILHLHMERILALASKGLHSSQTMVVTKSPWHHAANIPFQVVCLLLAVDTRASHTLLKEAMHTLRQVAFTWNSAVMREAYNTAYLLILLHKRRKDEDSGNLGDVLDMHSPSAPPASLGVGHRLDSPAGTNPPADLWAAANAAEISWLEDLIADMPALREIDLEQFLMQDGQAHGSLGVNAASSLL